MFEMPKDAVAYFFKSIIENGKYRVSFNGTGATIIPRDEDKYYKPNIFIEDLTELDIALRNYVNTLNKFYSSYDNLQHYHTLQYFFNMLLFNMTATDANDLVGYINKRSLTFGVDVLQQYDLKKEVAQVDDTKFYAKRVLESPGLETPFCMLFSMQKGEKVYELPLVRYSIDGNVCYLFAVQMGRGRKFEYQSSEYKDIINRVNRGMKEYRNVPPNFVVSLALFLRLLTDHNIDEIIVPDFLFGRYRKYFGANTEVKSNEILSRILNGYMNLLNRVNLQIEGFDIVSYPGDVDSFMRIKFRNLSSNNELLDEIVRGR